MRAAGLEWHERGDVWDLVARERPLPADVTTAALAGMTEGFATVLHADTAPGGPLLGADGPLASAAPWADACRRTGASSAPTPAPERCNAASARSSPTTSSSPGTGSGYPPGTKAS